MTPAKLQLMEDIQSLNLIETFVACFEAEQLYSMPFRMMINLEELPEAFVLFNNLSFNYSDILQFTVIDPVGRTILIYNWRRVLEECQLRSVAKIRGIL